MPKSFFVDLSRCTACRGCQVACKQWNKNPAEETRNLGSYQNPSDVSAVTFKLVRFEEVEAKGALRWLFFPEQCRHCEVPPCKMIADSIDETAVIKDERTGAVLFTEKLKDLPFEDVRAACPYDIPRQDAKTGLVKKCTMCFDRISNGLLPACVQSCPTGTMNFGEREDMLALAKQRLAEVRKIRPEARLGDEADVNVIYLFEFDPSLYFKHAALADASRVMSRKTMLSKLLKPARNVVG